MGLGEGREGPPSPCCAWATLTWILSLSGVTWGWGLWARCPGREGQIEEGKVRQWTFLVDQAPEETRAF